MAINQATGKAGEMKFSVHANGTIHSDGCNHGTYAMKSGFESVAMAKVHAAFQDFERITVAECAKASEKNSPYWHS